MKEFSFVSHPIWVGGGGGTRPLDLDLALTSPLQLCVIHHVLMGELVSAPVNACAQWSGREMTAHKVRHYSP